MNPTKKNTALGVWVQLLGPSHDEQNARVMHNQIFRNCTSHFLIKDNRNTISNPLQLLDSTSQSTGAGQISLQSKYSPPLRLFLCQVHSQMELTSDQSTSANPIKSNRLYLTELNPIYRVQVHPVCTHVFHFSFMNHHCTDYFLSYIL